MGERVGSSSYKNGDCGGAYGDIVHGLRNPWKVTFESTNKPATTKQPASFVKSPGSGSAAKTAAAPKKPKKGL